MNNIKIHVLQCGWVGVDKTVPDRSLSKNSIAYTGLFRSKKNRIWLPVNAFLIEHPNGLVLIDTGWDKQVREHPIQAITFNMWYASKPKLPEGMAIDEQLKKIGYDVQDIDYIIMSHMDIDHASGLNLVRNAKNIIASEEEIKAINSHQIRYPKNMWKDFFIKPIVFCEDCFAPFKKSIDLFHDRSIIIFYTPGHSQGSVSVKVFHHNEYVLIVGDTGYNKNSWNQLLLSGPVYDKNAMLKSLKWVQDESRDIRCKAILASHDTDYLGQTIEL